MSEEGAFAVQISDLSRVEFIYWPVLCPRSIETRSTVALDCSSTGQNFRIAGVRPSGEKVIMAKGTDAADLCLHTNWVGREVLKWPCA